MPLNKKDAVTRCLLDMLGSPSDEKLSAMNPALAKQVSKMLDNEIKNIYTSHGNDNDPSLHETPKPK